MSNQEMKRETVELNDKDLDAVSGGMQTTNPVLIAVYQGMIKGLLESGATVNCHALRPLAVNPAHGLDLPRARPEALPAHRTHSAGRVTQSVDHFRQPQRHLQA